MLNPVAQHSSNWCKTYDRKQKNVFKSGDMIVLKGTFFFVFFYKNKREGQRVSSIGDAALV